MSDPCEPSTSLTPQQAGTLRDTADGRPWCTVMHKS